MKAAEQQLYDEMFRRSQALGFQTFDQKPLNHKGYPFVCLGETQTINLPSKTRILGEVIMRIHVWGSHKKREQVSGMLAKLFSEALKIESTETLRWSCGVAASGQRMIEDISTGAPLWHGILDLCMNIR